MAEEIGGSSGEHLANSVDDLYLFALLAEEDPLPAADEKDPLLKQAGDEASRVLFDQAYATLLQLQEVLVSSADAAAASPPGSSQHPHKQGSYYLRAANELPETTAMAGEPSCKLIIFCDICAESKPPPEMFENPTCAHMFCRECVCRHISINLQGNITAMNCLAAGCDVTLQPEECREIVPADVFDRWGTALCEAMLLGSRRFYCPFGDCSAPLLNDGEEEVRACECPHCHRLFCAKCGVPWHAGVECEEFQNLGADERGGKDLMLLDLAKSKNWKRCPSCRFYVEKGEGCLHITCRCGFQFCYGCGLAWTNAHSSCHT